MKLTIAENALEVCRFAAGFVVRRIKQKPNLVLGLAAGNTMVAFYNELSMACRRGEVSFREVTTFNLDEFVGLGPDHPGSFACYMRRHFFDHVDVNPDRTFLLDGRADSPLREARRYEETIAHCGGIDLQVLGIGRNGHIAFNEPGSSLASRTRVKRLAPSTVEAYGKYFAGPEAVPSYVLTMGVGTVMEAGTVLLLAHGKAKANAVASMAEGPVTAVCPASVLQMHPHAFVVVDRAASSLLRLEYDTVERVLNDPNEEFFFEGN